MAWTVHETIRAGLRDLPSPVRAVVSMLSYEERALLFGLARDHYRGAGAIVDAGAFVGGSTVSLAAGLTARGGVGAGIIHSYDRLVLDDYQKAGYFADDDTLTVGGSLREVFERNVAAYRRLVTLHEGDLLAERWDGGPVEILFIDVCKSWELNAHVVKQFFGALIPRQSIVVQQDLVHWAYPWCAIVMEALADHFRYEGWTWYASSVWTCIEPLRSSEVEVDWHDEIGLTQGLRLLRRAARRAGAKGAPLLELARATLLLDFGRPDQALTEVERVQELYGSAVPHLEDAYRQLRERVAAEG